MTVISTNSPATMEDEAKQELDLNLQPQLILLAATHHDLESLRTLLRHGSASVQDPDTGFTPLHAAIFACDSSSASALGNSNASSTNDLAPEGRINGASGGDHHEHQESDLDAAAKTMRLLLQNGAIWNDVDKNNETPGCMALRLRLTGLYEIMVDAGVRAEMLLNRLDEYEELVEQSDGEDKAEEEVPELVSDDKRSQNSIDGPILNGHSAIEASASAPRDVTDQATEPDLENDNYLQSSLRFQDGRIVDDANNGVMMAWETDIMKRTADLLAPRSGLAILNIGHGMGIVDNFFQETYPRMHHIIEAHPAVLARMKKDGWYEKPNVTIHEGRWQDEVPKIIEQAILFDAIYFDSFAEDYKALRDFFSDYIIGLLDDSGKWGYFNGLGADRQICYDVYGKVVEMDLFEAGYDTEWETLQIPEISESEWEGVKRKYWTLKEYKLPICRFIT